MRPSEVLLWVGRLSVVGARGAPPKQLVSRILERSREERTLPIVSRNLGIPCEIERLILGRQLLARRQGEEIRGRIDAIPFKGLDLAHRSYPSPGLRDMGDIDLLVRREDAGEADRVLRELGYRPPEEGVGPAPGHGGLLNAAQYVRGWDLPVHLHWHVSNASLPHFMYRIDVEEIWTDAQDGAMAPHHRVVVLCEHALKHSYSELILLADIELASRGVDPDLVQRTARRWGLERAVFYAASLLRGLLGVEPPALGGLRIDPGWMDRAFLRWALRRRWNGLSALGFLAMAEGLGGKARFVRESLAPREGRHALATPNPGGRLVRALGMIRAGITSP